MMEGDEGVGVGCSSSSSSSSRDKGKLVISHTSKRIKKRTKKKRRAKLAINRYQFKEDCDFSEAIRLGQFAVDDENRKTRGMIRELVFLSVEHVVRESTITSDIYYLTIKAKSFDENQPMFFKTAVRVPNQKQYPIESVGLIYSEENKVQLPGVILLQDDDIEVHTVAEFAVKVHNGNSQLVSLVAVVNTASSSIFPEYVKHSLTLLIMHRRLRKCLLCETTVIKYKGDNFMESMGINFLYEYHYINYVTVDLVARVRGMFHDEDFFWPELLPLYRDDRSIHRLSEIAKKFGEVMTRESLIPFLNKIRCHYVEENVLCAIAEELGVFLPYVGGVDYAHVLLPPLEVLCSYEDVDIRNEAVDSLSKIGMQMKKSDSLRCFIPLVKRLANSTIIAHRVSSCGLFHIAYPSAPENLRTDLRLLYGQLCKDDITLVRRSAALSLTKLAGTVEPCHLKTDIIPMFESLSQDGQEFVRLFSAKSCTRIKKLLEPQDFVEHILPAVLNMSQDASLRVRYAVADLLCDFCEAVVTESTRVNLVSAYVCLLRDNEAVIRKAAAEKLSRFCSTLNSELAIEHIIPCVKELLSDSAPNVRISLASEVMEIAPVLGKDAAIEKLVPIIDSLIQDENSFVLLKVVTKHNQVNQVVGDDLLSQSLLNATCRLAKDSNWWVRLAIAEYIHHLANQSNVDELITLCRQSLTDEDSSVCNAAYQSLERLAPGKNGSAGNANVP